MSEFWIVSGSVHEEHASLAEATRERDLLAAHFPDKTFRIFRCKRFLHSARHFPKLVELLRDEGGAAMTLDEMESIRAARDAHFHCEAGCEKTAFIVRDDGELVCVACGCFMVECTPDICGDAA
jgi:hypothetical protein